MTNLLQFFQAWEFQSFLCLFNFIYLFCFKFVNVLGKSTINDGGLALCLSMTNINYGRLTLSLSMTSINNGGLVKTFEVSFHKPVLERLFQCFHLY